MAFNEEPEAEVLPLDEVGGMKVEAIAGRSHVLIGARNPLHVVVRLTTPQIDESQAVRPPLHVACVMDCSGSMSGHKLDYAKKAVLKLVKHLHAEDTLHLVAYSSTARIVFQSGDLSETGKEALRQQVESLRAEGQTNLCGGLNIAAALLGGTVDDADDSDDSDDSLLSPPPSAKPGSSRCFAWRKSKPPARKPSSKPVRKGSKRQAATKEVAKKDDGILRRIFLFSDGRVNRGLTNPHAIRARVASWAGEGIVTGSFGIGADFDEPLMRGIAASGQGRYQFLATARDIPKLVSKSVHDLIDVFATEAMLDLRGGEYTIVTRVYGGHDEDGEGDEPQSAPGVVHLGDIHSDNLRVVLAELDVAPPGNTADGHAFGAAEWVLTCQRNGLPAAFRAKCSSNARATAR